MNVTVEKHNYVNTAYDKLARQVSLIRWIIPPGLFLFVFSFEMTEHTIIHDTPLNLDFYLELLAFGVFGPILITIILSWIVRNLRELEKAYQAINTLNNDLEKKVAIRTEKLARANEELRELDNLKSEFVSLVSHELRAPLTNIHGGLELVLADQGTGPVSKSNLVTIQNEVNRLIRLVQRILSVSVMESGQLALNLGPVALRPMLRKVTERMLLSNPGHHATLDFPDQLRLAIADEAHLEDIITNLMQNAIKYSPDGGEINVVLRFEGDSARINIRDHGMGIPPQDIPHLTEKFYRGSRSNNTSGYGLGLYFVSELIKAQGGQLRIESEGIPGKGSCFSFTIPLEKEALYEHDPAY